MCAFALCCCSRAPSENEPAASRLDASHRDAAADTAADRDCTRLANRAPPVADQPTPRERQSLQGCDSRSLYFGFGQAPDPERACKCAYLEIENSASRAGAGPSLSNRLFSGRGLLVTIYATGRGAIRDFDVALGLACRLAIDEQERDAVVSHIQALREEPWKAATFTICDDLATTESTAQCEDLEQERASSTRGEILGGYSAHWSDGARAKFSDLRAAAGKFFEARENTELWGGYTYPQTLGAQREERTALEEGFLNAIEGLEAGRLPRYSAVEARRARTELANVRAKLRRMPECGGLGASVVEADEPLWDDYLRAWVAFGAARYPVVPRAEWLSWLAQERANMLERVIGEIGLCAEYEKGVGESADR